MKEIRVIRMYKYSFFEEDYVETTPREDRRVFNVAWDYCDTYEKRKETFGDVFWDIFDFSFSDEHLAAFIAKLDELYDGDIPIWYTP